MIEGLSTALLLAGATLLLLAAIGLTRMPDLFTRMQATAKGTTLGISCMLLAVAAHFMQLGITSRALATIVFFFLTAPVTAHLIGRAAYFMGLPLWSGSVIDELRDKYDPRTGRCESRPVAHAARPPSAAADATERH